MAVADWWPVLCGLAGADPSDSGPGKVAVDGIDIWQALLAGARTDIIKNVGKSESCMVSKLALLAGSPSPRVELIVGMGAQEDAEGGGPPVGTQGSLRVPTYLLLWLLADKPLHRIPLAATVLFCIAFTFQNILISARRCMNFNFHLLRIIGG